MCACASDFHNLGGGYIFSGVDENQGQPVLPAAGFPANKLDSIQKKFPRTRASDAAHYHPDIAPYVIQQKHILALWCPTLQSFRIAGLKIPGLTL
jgi:ATP-dependent DNA helicase RecG